MLLAVTNTSYLSDFNIFVNNFYFSNENLSSFYQLSVAQILPFQITGITAP